MSKIFPSLNVGIKLEPGEEQTFVVRSLYYHISMASLDLETVENEEESFPILLQVNNDDDAILCNLSKNYIPQAILDVNLEKDAVVKLYTTGTATIHLIGHKFSYDEELCNLRDSLSTYLNVRDKPLAECKNLIGLRIIKNINLFCKGFLLFIGLFILLSIIIIIIAG